jgi:hypothetical protein
VANPEEPEPVEDADPSTDAKTSAIRLESLDFESDHGLLKDCGERFGWKNAGTLCPHPEWTHGVHAPVSHTMDLQVKLRLRLAGDAATPPTISGAGPLGMAFLALSPDFPREPSWIHLASDRRLEKKVRKLGFSIHWSTPGESELVVPARTHDIMYVTMGLPLDDQ